MTILKGMIFDIYHGTTHDGPGLRSTVFFKGCPLRCEWCQNPEGIKPTQEIWWEGKNCIGCLSCKKACKYEAILDDANGIRIDKDNCCYCGQCVAACPAKALDFTGVEWTVEELLKEMDKKKDYYEIFNGGVTASGGEPLTQYQFLREFFKGLKTRGIHTALDTCGLAPQEIFGLILPFTDCALFDLKILNSALHQKYTGQSNELILDNLVYVAEYIRKQDREVKLWIRTPLIPEATANERNITEIGRFITESLSDTVELWELCAFNNACKTKYQKMHETWAFADKKILGRRLINQLKVAALSTGFPEEQLVVSGIIAEND